MSSSERREYIIEKAVVFAGSSLVSCVRAGRTNSSGNANAPHAVGEEEHRSWGSERAGSPRHIACANEPPTCGEVLDLLHPPTGWLREDEDLATQMKDWARDGARH